MRSAVYGIDAFRRLPATVVTALAHDYPTGMIPVDLSLIGKLVDGYKARPGDAAAILTVNAPSGIRNLWELARSEILGQPMPPMLRAAIHALAGYVLELIAFTPHPRLSMEQVEQAYLYAMEQARGVYHDISLESTRQYWLAMAFAEVAISRATLHATGKATHEELALLVDHYCDCTGDYRHFFEEFPYEDGPTANTVAVVAGFAELGVRRDFDDER